MSRPPQQEPLQSYAAANRRNIIDFVGVPVNAPSQYTYDDAYVQSMYPQTTFPCFQGGPVGAAMPGGQMMGAPCQMPGPMVPNTMAPTPMVGGQMPCAYQPTPGGMQQGAWVGGPYQYMQGPYPTGPYAPGQQQAFMAAPYAPGAQTDPLASANQSQITEESLRNKINSKIESIMEMQKADMLSNQIEKLSDKVQKLSHNIEMKSTIKATEGGSISSTPSSREDELNARLKRLAAESSRKAAIASRRSMYE